MFRRDSLTSLLVLTVALGFMAAAVPAAALEVWSGRTFLFTRPNGADWTLPVNQDRIRPNVWLTRKSTQGLFNIAQEAGYSADSPTGTEWATGNAANFASLTFQPWIQWASNNPPGTIGVDAVVHLVSEDIYIDIRFDSFTGSNQGGGFSYYRAVQPTVPAVAGTWGRLKALYR